jgi:hypothetical protein
MNTPVLLIVFNRPETTQKVFDAIRAAKPECLYVAADGHRNSKPGEAKLCADSRKIATAVDWSCDLKTSFQDKNLGCGPAVSQAISWFFENEPEGIILEDDCVPDASFFPYCEKLLERYRNDQKIALIAGTNWQNGVKRGMASYYFSSIPHTWGWASWRRVWKNFSLDLNVLAQGKPFERMTRAEFPKEIIAYYRKCLWLVENEKVNAWDYQFFLSFVGKQLSVVPNVNLITNIGYLTGGTHGKKGDTTSSIAASSIEFPLIHPKQVKANRKADLFYARHHLAAMITGFWHWKWKLNPRRLFWRVIDKIQARRKK